MTKQDRSVKKQREAENAAGRIIEEAKAKVAAAANPAAEPARRTRALAPELAAMGEAVKAARDAGVAWWRIAHDLGLPGSADSVAKGKAGAALARRIYSNSFGALPPRPVSERTARKRSEKNEHVKAVRSTSKEQRVAQARSGQSVIPEGLTDEELLAMLKGRSITWSIDLNDLDGKGHSYSDETALVHPRWVRLSNEPNGDRVVIFKTMEAVKGVKGDGRFQPGSTHTVRLTKIHTIGG